MTRNVSCYFSICALLEVSFLIYIVTIDQVSKMHDRNSCIETL